MEAKRIINSLCRLAAIASLTLPGFTSTAQDTESIPGIEDFNIVWTKQSKNSGESMPVGGGDIGLNVWVENGDVLFYVAQSGCIDENGALLKHGRFRISLEPNPFAIDGVEFHQELKLRESCIEIIGQANDAPKTTMRIWVEVHRPVVHVDIKSSKPVSASATFETWRYQDILLPDEGHHQQRGMMLATRMRFPDEVWLYKDTVEESPGLVTWFHRMRNDKCIFEYTVRQQDLETVRDQLYDPLTDLTFGGSLMGDEFEFDCKTEGIYAEIPFEGWRYKSKAPAQQHHVNIYCHIEQATTVKKWEESLLDLVEDESPTYAEAWQKNLSWWGEFWDRNYIFINSDKANAKDKAWQVGRNYNLFRYQLGCNVSGRQPTWFSGGLFTFDPMFAPHASGPGWTPDWRRWGAGLWGQNQRLIYWPMLASGDFEIMIPQFEFYRKGLPSATARTKHYWGHDGCCFEEMMSVFCLPGCAAWGFVDAADKPRPKDHENGVVYIPAVRYLYQAQLEFSYMMLKYHRYSGRDIKPYMPFIDGSVRFYDEHYRMRKKERDGNELDENGHLVIFPSIANEMYYDSMNPADVTAGLHAVLEALLELDDDLVPAERRAEYKGMLARVPPVPTTEMEGVRMLAPAVNHQTRGGKEIPELYPLFPYDRYGLGRDGLDLALQAWKHTGGRKSWKSWHQGGIFCSRLGFTNTAKNYAISKLADSGRRFPTFWGPGRDWIPDNDQGGSGMIGLQEMILQARGKKILLLPACPPDWDLDFKLHAPYQTVVQGRVRSGKLTSLKVVPEERREDLVIWNSK